MNITVNNSYLIDFEDIINFIKDIINSTKDIINSIKDTISSIKVIIIAEDMRNYPY